MRRARFLIFSSEWYENFPVTIAEAFACGVPVVCSRMGAMQEIVEDGRTGLHFTPGDAADLAAKVDVGLESSASVCGKWGKEARREYENQIHGREELSHADGYLPTCGCRACFKVASRANSKQLQSILRRH